MADDKFDCIVVGAGPAGTAAAITMAKAGLNIALLERGEFAGAKNVQGAVMYSKMLADVVPEFWKDCPLERHIVDEKVWLTTPDSIIQMGYKSARHDTVPANSYTIIRSQFDRWFTAKAEEAGVTFVTGVTVNELVRKGSQIIGVKTTEGDELLGDVVIAADGVNSILAQKAGIHREWKPTEVALGVKEVIALPKEKIEDRFNLEDGQGATIEMFGGITQGMLGYAFLYTNKETLSLGVGCAVDELQRTLVKPYDLLEAIKRHPAIRPLIRGGETVEYSGHLIPEGGYKSMPPLFTGGMLICGDAAQMINPAHREGSNLAMESGRLAAETVIEAKKKNDFSSKTLSLYKQKLQASFILQDLKDYKDVEDFVRENRALLEVYPGMIADAAHNIITVDGRTKREHKKEIMKQIFKKRSPLKLMGDGIKMGIQAAKGMF